ncbi:MAG TPA: sulfatase-like hydrolase/transferase, partial [Thermoanaerobaculia bacterium]|nr:sulfatase-like hydrolase/transferase [Thermoanaerobaculia bacterium]
MPSTASQRLRRLAAAFVLLLCACTRHEVSHPNVLLITLDTFRADRIGANTPNLRKLASESVVFANADSAVPLTLPSHATILSGLLPPHHGVRNNGSGSFPADRPTLATVFSAGGYRTAAFTGAFVVDHKFGLNRGFDLYDDEIPRDPTLGDHLEAERRGDVVVDRALRWLAREDSRPFFAWVHLYDAHFPYVPPRPYPQTYDGEIAFVDAQVGRLLAAVDWTRTIVVVAGDHGEALGDHGELTHGLLLYESTLHVPLVVCLPGGQQKVVSTPVSLSDIAPTVAALAHLAFPGATDGVDLSNVVRDGRKPAAKGVYSETEYPTLYGWSGLASMRRGMQKYIAAPAAEVYDLAADPNETRNVINDERRGMRSLDADVKAMQASAVARPTQQPDAETMAKLAALGYVGGTAAPRPGSARPDPKVMLPLFRRFEEATWATTAKHLDEAAAILEDLVRRDPPNPVFRSSLAKVERQLGRPQRAIGLYRDAIAFAPDDPQGWYNLASAFQEAGDMKRAADAAREALRRDATNADAHNVLGIAYLNGGQPAEALAQFRAAIAIDPRNARAYNNVGNVCRSMQRV